MNGYDNLWPKGDDLKASQDYTVTPFAVLSKFSEAIYESYEHKLAGMVTARNVEFFAGDKTHFCYGLYLVQVKSPEQAAQIKILELEVQDDGWYPCTVSQIKAEYGPFGKAENETQLIELLKKAVNTDFVKSTINRLLNS